MMIPMLQKPKLNRRQLRRLVEDGCVLLLFSLLFSMNFLFSPSSQIPGFPHRQDAYSYIIVAQHMLELMRNGIAPFGTTWLRQSYCGLPEVVSIDPLYSVYLSLLVVTNSFVLSSKFTVFFFYALSSVAMYYLTYILVKKRVACLVSSLAYTYTQIIVFEMLQGHISMISGFAFIPFVVAFYINTIRRNNPIWPVLTGAFLWALIVMRTDFAYYTISFLALLFFYFVKVLPGRLKTLINTAVMFLLAFLLGYPFLEPRFISTLGWITNNVGRYNYQFYSPPLYLPFIPFISSQGAYLGISILFYSLFGGSISLLRVYRSRKRSSEDDKFYVLLLILALVFLMIGLGSSGPLYGLLNQLAPFFSAFRVPTRWLVITALCLAVLAGKGALDLLNMVKRENYKKFLMVLTLLLISLDLSVYVAPITYVQNGWAPIMGYSQDYAIFVSPQTSNAPEENMAYQYVSLDDTGSFRVLAAPIVYSESYYQYARYLKDTNITFAHNYVQFPLRSEFQADVYSGFRYGNFSQNVGDQMALLGVKYLVYNYYWGEWTALVAKMNQSQDLEFVLADNGYILYRNKRFGNVETDNNMILNSGFEEEYTAWDPWHRNGGITAIDSTTSHAGKISVKVTSLSLDEIAGRSQYVYLPESTSKSEFKLSAWCKAENVSGVNPYLAARATIVYDDDSATTAARALFSSGTHDWEYSSAYFTVDPQKTVKYIVVSLFLRNATGTAWFDNVFLGEKDSSNEWDGGFPVKELHSDANALLSEENKANANISIVRDSPLSLRLRVDTTEPCHLVVSESYDEGWRVAGENPPPNLSIQNYNGLIRLFIPTGGTYDISLIFVSYFYSLDKIMLFHSTVVVLIILYYVAWSHATLIMKFKAAALKFLRQKLSRLRTYALDQ